MSLQIHEDLIHIAVTSSFHSKCYTIQTKVLNGNIIYEDQLQTGIFNINISISHQLIVYVCSVHTLNITATIHLYCTCITRHIAIL